MIGPRLRSVIAIAGVAALIAYMAFTCVLSMRLDLRTAERDAARVAAKLEKNAHAETVANYRQASAAAQAKADGNVARVVAEQGAITERTTNDYQARLAAVDARYERVRAQLAARTHLRSTDLAPMSLASEATCQAYGGEGCDALLAKLSIAERQAENLVALRQWVRDQAKVIVTPDPR